MFQTIFPPYRLISGAAHILAPSGAEDGSTVPYIVSHPAQLRVGRGDTDRTLFADVFRQHIAEPAISAFVQLHRAYSLLKFRHRSQTTQTTETLSSAARVRPSEMRAPTRVGEARQFAYRGSEAQEPPADPFAPMRSRPPGTNPFMSSNTSEGRVNMFLHRHPEAALIHPSAAVMAQLSAATPVNISVAGIRAEQDREETRQRLRNDAEQARRRRLGELLQQRQGQLQVRRQHRGSEQRGDDMMRMPLQEAFNETRRRSLERSEQQVLAHLAMDDVDDQISRRRRSRSRSRSPQRVHRVSSPGDFRSDGSDGPNLLEHAHESIELERIVFNDPFNAMGHESMLGGNSSSISSDSDDEPVMTARGTLNSVANATQASERPDQSKPGRCVYLRLMMLLTYNIIFSFTASFVLCSQLRTV